MSTVTRLRRDDGLKTVTNLYEATLRGLRAMMGLLPFSAGL
jgi:hypothetical protein